MKKKTMNNKTKRTQKNASGPYLFQRAGPVLSDLLRVIQTRAGDEAILPGAGPVLSELLRRLRPTAEARGHFQTAHLEFFKGLRAYLEARIEQASMPHAKGEKISVE